PFGRPIRWLVALLDGQVVPFTIYDLENGAKGRAVVESGDTTLGHRFLPRGSARGPVRVRSYADLEARLDAAFVVLDPDKRERRIREGLAAGAGGAPKDDHGLVEEWRDLVEYPTVLVGRIPAEFRVLPKEVLETVLVHHQKYIPLSEGGAVRGRDGAGHGARGGGAAARRGVLLHRGPQAAPRRSRGRPGGRDVPSR